MQSKVCVECRCRKGIGQFYVYGYTVSGGEKREGRRAECKSCQGKRASRRIRVLSAYVSGYKMSVGCARCGYREHAAALEFDHLDGSSKSHAVADMVKMGASRDSIIAEMEKCQVLCANCHRVVTWERRES